MDMMENYKRWLGKVTEEDLLTELKAIEGKEEEINDRFYRDLEFGTGGLRGVIGAGTYRMNGAYGSQSDTGIQQLFEQSC